MKTPVRTRPVVSKRRRSGQVEILEARIAPANAFAVDTSNNLLQFDTATPGTIIDTLPITGLGGDTIIGIDFRPADGLLYGVGKNGATGHIFSINASTGAATLVSTLAADLADATAPYAGLAGAEFGVDFNPVPDRLRVVSNLGENLRINVTTGLVITDGNLNPGTPNIVGAAYTNSAFGATTTTLFTIDATTDTLFTQNPPNNGMEVAVGPLGVNVGNVLEFDILAGAGGSNTAFLAATVGGTTGLYTVNLTTGAATLVGAIGGGGTQVRGLAVTGNFTATAGTFTGTTNAETLVVTESSGMLRHNRFDAGDVGFASAFDFNSTVAGDQTLAVGSASIVNVTGSGGADFFSATRSTDFNAGTLNLPTGRISLTTSAGAILSAGASVTGAGLSIVAATGIGSSGTPLATSVSNFEASTTAGGIFVSNTGTALTLGGVNATLTGVSSGGGDISVLNDNAITVTEAVAASGAGAITLTTTRNISVSATGSISVVDGALMLSANQQASPTAGDFGGIAVSGGTVSSTGLGTITLLGRGGDTPMTTNRSGVGFDGNATLSSVSGNITIHGRSGTGLALNPGVAFTNDSDLTTVSGTVDITGIAGASTGAGATRSVGVWLFGGGTISSTGTGPAVGSITIHGTGGAGVTENMGIWVVNPGSAIRTVDADLSFTGIGGNGTGTQNFGFIVSGGALVESTGTGVGAGNITINGTGGAGAGSEIGVLIADPNTRMRSVDGDISITGFGGTGSGSFKLGVGIFGGAVIETTGTGAGAGNLVINATGGSGIDNNSGILIGDAATRLGTVDGGISITGNATAGTGFIQVGVNVFSGAVIETTGTGADAGNLVIFGNGAAGTGLAIGVQVAGANTRVSVVGSDLFMRGQGGAATGGENIGIRVIDGGLIRSTGAGVGAGSILLDGTGGGVAGASQSNGVGIRDAGSLVTSLDGAITIIGTAGTGTDTFGIRLGTNGGLAGAVTSTGLAPITFIADSIALDPSAIVAAALSTVTLRQETDGTLIDLGGADGVNTLGLTNAELNVITAANIIIGNGAAGNLTITDTIAPMGTSQLELVTGGQISSTNPNALDVIVARLGLTAVTGIGVGNPIVTEVANLEASTNTGGIFAIDGSDLTIGGVNSTLTGLSVATSGDISVTVGATLTLADTNGSETIKGGSTSGDITLVAGLDLIATLNNDAITAPGGRITVVAGQDILFGTVAFQADNDVRASGSVTLTGGRNVTIAGFSDVSSDDFGNNTGGSLTIAAGNDLSISEANGDDASASANGTAGADVTLTAGSDRFVSLTPSSSDAVFSQSGGVTINADRLFIDADSGVTASNGMVLVQPLTAGRLIDLGSTTDLAANTLEISAIELSRFFTPLLRIGNSLAGNITVTAPVNAQNAPTLSLTTGGSITSPAPGSITATNLALHAGNGIGTAATPLATIVSNLAFLNFGNLVNISNTGLLTINSVDDLPTSDNFGGTTTLTAGAGAGPTPGGIVFAVDTHSFATLTANATESPQPQDDVRVKFLVEVVAETGDVIFNAGDGIIAEENSFIGADDEVRLSFGVNDADGISFIDLRGFITARTLTLVGSSIHETITLANLDKIDVRLVSIFTGVGQPDSVTLLDNALSNEINASLRLGTYIEVLGFRSEVRVYETNTADTLTLAGREGNDTIVAQPGVESLVSIILDGGTGNDTLLGNGILVGGEGNDTLNGGTGNDTLLGDGGSEFLFGLTAANELVRFSPEAPDSIVATLAITGLQAGETLVGLDVRPATGALYALGNTAGVGRLYTVDPLTGAATLVATLAADPADLTSPYAALGGTEFGVDFNPVPDRLRVVSDAGQNLRINVDTGLVTTDGDINGATASIIGAAYANNFAGATATTLFTIDAGTNSLFTQNPPNNGTEVLVGALGVDVDAVLGFDIVPGTGTAFAALSVGGVSGLYTIDLFNGRATLVGNFGGGATLRGLAIGATQGNDTINGAAGNDTLVGGFGNDVLSGGTGNDRIEAGDGDDALDGGDGTDTLNGFTGNDVLSGGAGLDTLIGGTGTDVLRETRDADFTLTNAALTIGTDGAETLNSFERVELTGGTSANRFNVGAFTGSLRITGGDGSDTLDYSASALGVAIDIDAVGTVQVLNASGVALTLGDVTENFTGTPLNDVIFASVQNFPRLIDGQAPSTQPGLPGAPIPPGDTLTVDGLGQFARITKFDNNTGTVTTPGFGDIAFDDVEVIDTINSSSSGGFGGTDSNGGSAFSASVSYGVGKAPTDVASGDLNGDGFDDIVTVNTGSKSVSVLLSRGDGTFFPAVDYATGGKGPRSVVLANIDDNSSIAGGDGDLDIVVTNIGSNSVSVLLNDGLGAFGTATKFKTAAKPSTLRVADFNEDGLLDIAALSKSTATISVLLNTGGGAAGTASFGAFTRVKPGGATASDFVAGNFDGDANGHIDFAVVRPGAQSVVVLTGDGLGQFTAQPTRYKVGKNPTVMAVADFNNDGILDIVVNQKLTQFVSILIGRGNAGGDLFEQRLPTSFKRAVGGSETLVIGDFDGDGNADLAFGSVNGTAVRIALGTGAGLFQPLVRFELAAVPSGTGQQVFASGIAVGDFNGDGAPDIVVANRMADRVNVAIRTPTV